MSSDSPAPNSARPVRFWVVWGIMLAAIAVGEGFRWSNPDARTFALTERLCGPEADWLPLVPAMVLGLVAVGIRRKSSRSEPSGAQSIAPIPQRMPPSPWGTLFIGILAFTVAAASGWSQKDRPPAYHDEYSYLFQTHTFLAGRTWFPSFELMPQIFDQMHVLNEGRFASRYFPGAGMWFLAFHGVGPIWGQWFAQAVTAIGALLVGTHIAGRLAGLIAGLAVALCPGLVLFSQLYLAHHPTLVGLTLFLVTFLRLKWHCEHGNVIRRKERVGVLALSFASGLGLSYAMLCRPMTAAAVGLPFGIWLFRWALTRNSGQCNLKPGQAQVTPGTPRIIPRAVPILMTMAIPILGGIGLQLIYNKSITGQVLTSPYQLYTDTYTPRHVYGFSNVTRGEQHLSPKVIDRYDRWAENLTLPLALTKMKIRLVTSGRWTLGLVPLIGVVAMLICRWKSWSSDFRLIVASIISLHLAHLPYWFEGIMGWHYVFESAPLWGIVLGVVTVDFFRWSRESGFPAFRWWWAAILVTSLSVSWVSVPSLWAGRIERGLSEVAFSRNRYEQFDQLLHDRVVPPAIVFIRHDPDEVHIDFVNNTPELDGPVLRARAPSAEFDLRRAVGLFPDRTAWLFDVKSGTLRRISSEE